MIVRIALARKLTLASASGYHRIIDAAKRSGADQVELCTAEYAELTLAPRAVFVGLNQAVKEMIDANS